MAFQYLDARQVSQRQEVDLRIHQDETLFWASLGAVVERPRHVCLPSWHFDMLLDARRTEAYSAAIQRAIERKHLAGSSNIHVLDAGAGSGLLSLLASRHGAHTVSAVEFPGHVADLCEEQIILNGHFRTVQVLHKAVKNVESKDLPSKADILAMEVFDCGLIGEGALHILNHAHAHLLKPDAICIPCGAALFIQAVQLDRADDSNGLDVSSLNAYKWRPDYESVDVSSGHNHALTYLTDPILAFSFDFYDIQSCLDQTSTDVCARVTNGGVLNGILFWFELYLDEEDTLSTNPSASESGSTWSQAIQWVKERRVEQGETLQVRATHDTNAFQYEVCGEADGETEVPLFVERWKAKYDETKRIHDQWARGLASNPEIYRRTAHALVQLAARAGDADICPEQASTLCMRCLS